MKLIYTTLFLTAGIALAKKGKGGKGGKPKDPCKLWHKVLSDVSNHCDDGFQYSTIGDNLISQDAFNCGFTKCCDVEREIDVVACKNAMAEVGKGNKGKGEKGNKGKGNKGKGKGNKGKGGKDDKDKGDKGNKGDKGKNKLCKEWNKTFKMLGENYCEDISSFRSFTDEELSSLKFTPSENQYKCGFSKCCKNKERDEDEQSCNIAMAECDAHLAEEICNNVLSAFDGKVCDDDFSIPTQMENNKEAKCTIDRCCNKEGLDEEACPKPSCKDMVGKGKGGKGNGGKGGKGKSGKGGKDNGDKGNKGKGGKGEGKGGKGKGGKDKGNSKGKGKNNGGKQ